MPILDRERLNNYPKIILILYILIYGFFIFSGSGYTDRMGKPIGGDFSQFWAVSRILLTGVAADVYDNDKIFSMEKSIAGVDYRNPVPYPPTNFFIVAPLALLPYIPSLILWVTVTFLVFLFMTYRNAPHPLTIWLTLSFPGAFQNAIHGHNGFVTASILGLALLIIEKRPFTAGMLLGVLSFKPHLLVIIPFFLLVGRAWRTLAGMGASVLGLVIASAFLFGVESWYRFFEKIPFMMHLLKGGYLQMHQVISPVGAFLLVGLPYEVALCIHLLFSVAAIGMAATMWHRNAPRYIKHSLMVLAILLVTPYANSYDLTLLALPLCWIGWEAYKNGNISNLSSFFLIAAWFLPIVSVFFAILAGLQIAPFFILCMLIWIYIKESPQRPPLRLS